MHRMPAGHPFDLVVVCNGGGLETAALPPPPAGVSLRVINRENQGYNIGAWDAGWRAAPGYDYYLFLQDECVIREAGWLAAFESRHRSFNKSALIGESIMWEGLDWAALTEATQRDFVPTYAGEDAENPIDGYRALLHEMDIPEGPVATHLQSLVLFADGDLLEKMGGLPNRSPYKEAVACEIGISRKAAALGAEVALVTPGKRFSFIAHPEWVGVGTIVMHVRRRWYWFKGWVKAKLFRKQGV